MHSPTDNISHQILPEYIHNRKYTVELPNLPRRSKAERKHREGHGRSEKQVKANT